MKKKFKKIALLLLSTLCMIMSTVPAFAHNAVYYDFLIGSGMNYELIPRDDLQSSSESGHYEWSPDIGGYFYLAGTGDRRPLFVYKEGTSKEVTPNGYTKHKHPGYLYDSGAQADRYSYYEWFTRYGSKGVCDLGKTHTLPPTNAKESETGKYLHMTTSSPELTRVTAKLNTMIKGFNELLNVAAPGDNLGVYSSVDKDFMATAEILADAIHQAKQGDTITVPIPIDDNKYNSVKIYIRGRTYDATVVRHDGTSYQINKAIRSVHTGFTKDKNQQDKDKGNFTIGGKKYIKDSNLDEGAWYQWGSNLYAKTTTGVPYTQDFDFTSDITLISAVIAANMKYTVWGNDSRNAYVSRDESILAREVSKTMNNLTDSLANILKLQDYDELIFNQGVRSPRKYTLKSNGEYSYTPEKGEENIENTLEYQKNDPYMLGMYRMSWQGTTQVFYQVFIIFGLIVIGVSMVKLLLHAQSIAVSPYFRNEAYKTIWNYMLVMFLIPLTWAIFYILAQGNYYIASLFGNAVGNESIKSLAAGASSSGSLGSIAISLCYFTAQIYFNVVYVLRSVNIVILMATSPLIISTLTLGPKYKNLFDTWIKELISNIFLQSFHAFILTFIVSVQANSSGVEEVILVLCMIPLTSMFRGLFLGGQTVGAAEQQGSKYKGAATGLMVAGALGGAKLAGTAIGGTVGMATGLRDKNIRGKLEDLQKNKDNMTTEDRLKLEKKFNNSLKRNEAIKQNAKPMATALLSAGVGAMFSMATDGNSLHSTVDGITRAGEAATGGLLDEIGKKIEGSGELVTTTKDIDSRLLKLNATKDTETAEYKLNKEQKAKLNEINDLPNHSDEKEEAMRNYLKKQAFNVRDDSKFKLSPDGESLSVTHANLSGKEATTLSNGTVVIKGFGPATGQNMTRNELINRADQLNNTNTMGYSDFKESVQSQVATTADSSNIGETLNHSLNKHGITDVAYNQNAEKQYTTEQSQLINSMEQLHSNGKLQNSDGSYSYEVKGTKFENITDIKSKGNDMLITQRITNDQSNLMKTRMAEVESRGGSKEEIIQARNNTVQEMFGEGAKYNTNGTVQIIEHNKSNMDIGYSNGVVTATPRIDASGNQMTPRFDNGNVQTRTMHTASQVISNTLEKGMNNTDVLTVDPNVYGNSKKFDLTNDGVSICNQTQHMIVNLKENVQEDLQKFYANNINGNNIQNEMKEYALNKHGIHGLEYIEDTGKFRANLGKVTGKYNDKEVSYNSIGYDSKTDRIIMAKDKNILDNYKNEIKRPPNDSGGGSNGSNNEGNDKKY